MLVEDGVWALKDGPGVLIAGITVDGKKINFRGFKFFKFFLKNFVIHKK